jgi:hypothetical protein
MIMKFGVVKHVVLVGALALNACTVATEQDENLDTVQQLFGSSSCGTVAANATFTDSLNHQSPSSYNNCYKGYVVDVDDLNVFYTGQGSEPWLNGRITISWAGTVPTTQSACESAWGSAVFYKWVSGQWVDQTGVLNAYGTWDPLFGGSCVPPSLSTSEYFLLQAGESYRAAGTMRTSYGGSNLRSMLIKTDPKTIIH